MINERLKLIRKKLAVNQNEMSEKFGVSYRAYTSYERGERKPTIGLFKNLYRNFNINLNWLITGEGEMFNRNPNEVYATTKIKEILKENGLI